MIKDMQSSDTQLTCDIFRIEIFHRDYDQGQSLETPLS